MFANDVAMFLVGFFGVGFAVELRRTRRYRKALQEIASYGYWGQNTSKATLIQTLDEVTDTAREALGETELIRDVQ